MRFSQPAFIKDVTSVHGKVATGLMTKVKLFHLEGTGKESADSNGKGYG